MSDLPYSKRELDEHFRAIKESLGRIEAQTVKTNGRVTKLEGWRSLLTGGLVVIGAIVLPLVVYAFKLATGK